MAPLRAQISTSRAQLLGLLFMKSALEPAAFEVVHAQETRDWAQQCCMTAGPCQKYGCEEKEWSPSSDQLTIHGIVPSHFCFILQEG